MPSLFLLTFLIFNVLVLTTLLVLGFVFIDWTALKNRKNNVGVFTSWLEDKINIRYNERQLYEKLLFLVNFDLLNKEQVEEIQQTILRNENIKDFKQLNIFQNYIEKNLRLKYGKFLNQEKEVEIKNKKALKEKNEQS